MSAASDKPMLEPRAGESAERFAKRHGVALGEAPMPAEPEPEAQPESAADLARRAGVKLHAESPSTPTLDEARREALDVARALLTGGSVTPDEAVAVVESASRECAAERYALARRERNTESLRDGSEGTLGGVKLSAEAVVGLVGKRRAVLAADLAAIDLDTFKSDAGKQHAKGERLQREAAEPEPGATFARNDALLDARQTVLVRELKEANAGPRTPSVEAQLLAAQRAASVLYVARAQGNDARLAEVVLRSAAAGDAAVTAGAADGAGGGWRWPAPGPARRASDRRPDLGASPCAGPGRQGDARTRCRVGRAAPGAFRSA